MKTDPTARTFWSAGDLRNLCDAVQGTRTVESALSPLDAQQDVLIMGSPAMAQQLEQRGIQVDQTLPDIGVTAHIDAAQLQALRSQGFAVTSNALRQS